VNANHPKPPSRRLVIIGGLIATGIIGIFFLVPCTLREAGFRAVLGRKLSDWKRVQTALRIYHMDRGHYPASLDEPDFQPYIDESLAAFLREGDLAYHPPAADSPPTFILLQLITPRGDYSFQLDGTPIYPNSK
jgi:hypothetical protein